jgi:hypothetical protein
MGLTLLDLSEAKKAALAMSPTPVKTKQALVPTLFGMMGDTEDPTYKRITAPNSLRDLNPVMHLRMQQIAFFLRATTPFGKRIVEVISDYVVGEGFTASATDAKVQEVVDRFWKDPINRLSQQDNGESNISEYCDELTTFGELCIPVTVNPVDGFVRLGYVDPQRIEAVEYATLNATNVSVADAPQEETAFPIAVRLRRRFNEPEGRRLEIIRVDEDPNSPTFGQLKGDCFYWSINKAKGASRGLSELFSLADWIDVFDQMIFDYADKVRFLNAFVWDYTVKGADEPTVKKYLKDLTQNPPRQGGVQVHNEQVQIEAKTPTMGGADMEAAVRLVKLYGLGGAGLPAWFFADPVDANRSTADEMTGPTGKKLTKRQNHVRGAIYQMTAFAVQQAIYHGVLPAKVDTTVKMQTPDLMIKDLQKAATTLGAATNALSVGEQNGWVKSETAARGFHVILSQIGIEVDSKAEFQAAQQEKQQREVNLVPDQTSLAKALTDLQQQQQQPGAGQ